MSRPLLPALLLLPACASLGGGRPCPRVNLPDELVIEGVVFGEEGGGRIEIEHACARGGTVEISQFSFDDVDHWSFREPPPRQVEADDARWLLVGFRPVHPTYAYDSVLTVVANGESQTVTLVGRADPDQDGDGVDAEEAGGTDCNDLDPEVQTVEPEVDDGIDNDCDGMVDEDFVARGDVRLTELMTQPRAVRAELGFFVELENTGPRTVNLRGWRIEHDEGRLQVQGDVMVEPGARVLLGPEADPELNGGRELDGLLVGDLIPDTPARVQLVGDGPQSTAELASWPATFGTSAERDWRSVARDADSSEDAWCLSATNQAGGERHSGGDENRRCPGLDFDGDGYPLAEDCDDTLPDVRPGAKERWNDLDDDCDGRVDDMIIEDRLEDELRGVGEAAGIVVGALDGDGRDHLAVAVEDRLYFVEPDATWSGQDVGSIAGSVVELDRGVGAIFGSRFAELGASAPEVLAWQAGEDGAVLVLERPSTVTARESDVLRTWIRPEAPLDTLTVTDLDGDGRSDVVVDGPVGGARDGVAVLDLGPTASGELLLADATVGGWSVPADAVVHSVEAVDFDADGYGDLVVGLRRDTRVDLQVVTGGAILPDGADLLAETELLWVGARHRGCACTFADTDGDGRPDLVSMVGGQALVYRAPFPPSLVGGAADHTLDLPPQEGFVGLERVDFDGDAPIEVVGVTSGGAAGRAWFLDDGVLPASGALQDHAATQWAPIRTPWVALPGLDLDGDGRDSLLFHAELEGERWLQRVPARP